jgi:lipoyl(octanoyl) transferase
MATDISYKIFRYPQDYGKILELQEKTREEVIGKKHHGAIFFLEHSHVYTVGIRGKEKDFIDISAINRENIPVHKIRRGGEVTWHGPGQLIIYPVINFRKAGFVSIKEFVNFFGESIREVLYKKCGIQEALWSEEKPGIWVDDKKIAFVGLHFRKFVPAHGFSVNLSPDFKYFATIIPCGMPDCKITSVKNETGKDFSVNQVSLDILDILREKMPDIYENSLEEQ